MIFLCCTISCHIPSTYYYQMLSEYGKKVFNCSRHPGLQKKAKKWSAGLKNVEKYQKLWEKNWKNVDLLV